MKNSKSFYQILITSTLIYMSLVIPIFYMSSCTDEGDLIEEQADALCVVLQQVIPLEDCQNAVDGIIAGQSMNDNCPDGIPTGDIQPHDNNPWVWVGTGLWVVTYITPNTSSDEQCKSTWITKIGTELPDSVEVVNFEDANIGSFEGFNGDVFDQTNDNIPPFYFEVTRDTVNLNNTTDVDGNVLFDDLIIYVEQGYDKVNGISNDNAICGCTKQGYVFPNHCKKFYIEDCLEWNLNENTIWGLRGIGDESSVSNSKFKKW